MRFSTRFLHSSSPPFRLLFCHGLGSAKADAQLAQEWTAKQANDAVEFQMIKYREYGREQQQRPMKPWTVESWVNDISDELQRHQISANQQQRTIAVCVSAGAQAFLRSISRSPRLLHGISGLLLISPGIGMQVDNYIQRVLPGHVEALRARAAVEHPSTDPSVQISIDLASLENYEQDCILRSDKPLPLFEFPVRIVHGIHDKLVPFVNSVELLERLRAKDKALFLVNSGHLISDKPTLLHAMDSIWGVILKKRMVPKSEENHGMKLEKRANF